MFYTITQYESNILSSNIDISQILLLEKNSQTRLQLISLHHKKFIKSIEDKNKEMRICILALLIKFYSTYSHANQQNLDKFKNIIYEAKLQELINSQGLQKECLHKLIVQRFNRLTVDFAAESHLISMFNSVPFFDEILIRSIQQKILLNTPVSLQQYSEDNSQKNEQFISLFQIQNFIKQNFNITIQWNTSQTLLENQPQNQIYLWKQNNTEVFKESILNMTYIDNSSDDQQSTFNFEDSKKNRSKKSTHKIFQTISINESRAPLQFELSLKRQFQFKFQNEKISGFSNFTQKRQSRKSKVKLPSKQKCFWDVLFCC